MVNIVIARDFSKMPFGRYLSDSPNSAERFRRDYLVPAMKSGDREVVVDFTGINHGVGSSFLEEAFGGLVRKEGVPKADIKAKLIIKSDLPFYKEQIIKFIDMASPEKQSLQRS
ncbi:TPA: STAS-like domain-containing protein [Enterobacter asburiae]